MQALTDIQLVKRTLQRRGDASLAFAKLYGRYQGKIAAIARYDDEVEKLMSTGTDYVFNMFTEAGAGLAEESLRMLSAEGKYQVTA